MSYANTFNTVPINSTNAQFQAWGANLSARFAAAGWTQTADTGQINWGTVATPAAVTTVQGYEIWGMTDALQATAPLYVKVEYASGTVNTTPGLYITALTGSNGTGGPVGWSSWRMPLHCTTNTATNVISYFSGANNRLTFGLWVANPNTTTPVSTLGIYFSIERTKDATGNDTGEGALIAARNPNDGVKCKQHYFNNTTGPVAVEDFGMFFPTVNTDGFAAATAGVPAADASQTPVYPDYFFKGGIYTNPGLNLLGYVFPGFQPDSPVTLSIYGASHTYMPLSNVFNVGSGGAGRGSGNCSFCFRYE